MTDKPLVPAFVLEQGMINPCLTRGADYEVYTESLRVDENAEPSRHILSMVGSSTIMDLQEDRMELSALDDMTKVPDGLLCYLNHQYQVPEDILGSLYGKPYVISSKGIADLHLLADVEMDNPRAAQAFNMVAKRKRRLGCSVGCQVTDFQVDPQTGGIVISHVTVLEWSLVSIPANQRCWVEVATKSLFERSLLEGRGDDALLLAPAVKGMYSRSYTNLVKHVESAGLKRDLERVSPRDTPPHRIMTAFNDGQLNFALADNRGVTKSLSRDEVSALLQKSTPARVVEAVQAVEEQKSASGKTDWPLADKEHAWDSGEAHKRLVEWAGGADNFSLEKLKQVHFWTAPEPKRLSDFKLPFCDVMAGKINAIPRAIESVAGVLQGAMGGVDIPSSDVAGVRAKVASYYKKMDMTPPWEQDSKKSAEGILDTDNGKDLVRQDLKETDDMDKDKMPKASEVECSADGSHVACTGTHTHAHKAYGSQGSDDLHEHEHAHDGDAHHGHSHEETKSVDNIVEKQLDVTQEPTSTELAEVTKAAEPAPVAENPQNMALLAAYNTIGKQLGFEPASLDAQKCMMGDANMQEAIGLISQVDACIDGVASRLDQADYLVDRLMSIYGIPDVDKMPGSEEAPAMLPMASYSAEVSFLKSFDMFLQKEGKELNEKNRGIIAMMHDHAKSVHDMAAAMHPESCKCAGMVSQGTDVESARQDAQYQMADGLTRSMEALAQALEKFSAPNLEKNFQRMKSEESALHKELASLKSNINALKNMPLGRPTQLNRSIEGEASYEGLKVAVGKHVTLKDALSATELVALGGSQYRRWPAGAGVGLRPALTTDQKSLMRPNDILAYQDGEAAYVPVIDDPEA